MFRGFFSVWQKEQAWCTGPFFLLRNDDNGPFRTLPTYAEMTKGCVCHVSVGRSGDWATIQQIILKRGLQILAFPPKFTIASCSDTSNTCNSESCEFSLTAPISGSSTTYTIDQLWGKYTL